MASMMAVETRRPHVYRVVSGRPYLILPQDAVAAHNIRHMPAACNHFVLSMGASMDCTGCTCVRQKRRRAQQAAGWHGTCMWRVAARLPALPSRQPPPAGKSARQQHSSAVKLLRADPGCQAADATAGQLGLARLQPCLIGAVQRLALERRPQCCPVSGPCPAGNHLFRRSGIRTGSAAEPQLPEAPPVVQLWEWHGG